MRNKLENYNILSMVKTMTNMKFKKKIRYSLENYKIL